MILMPSPVAAKPEKQRVPGDLFSRLLSAPWVDLQALTGSNRIVFILPNGSTFNVPTDTFIWLLGRLGFSEPEFIADYVWNFREVTLDMKTGLCSCTYERNRRIAT